jgi:ribose transport system ATP-binding protein
VSPRGITEPESATGQRGEPLLTMTGISKSFGRNRVLEGVDLCLRSGEVHALVGMNGSGKSTLIKVLAGIHAPAPGGSIGFRDAPSTGRGDHAPSRRPRAFSLTQAGERPGVGFVHQDLGLVPELSLLDNFALTFGYATTRRGTVDTADLRRKVESGLRRVGIDADPAMALAELGAADRSLFAIARALEQLGGSDAPVLVLDEPTAALPANESQRVMGVVRELTARGAAVLLVTHHLSEVMAVSDRVSVLRDGTVVLATATAEVGQTAVVEAMLGKAVEQQLARDHARDQHVVERGGEPRIRVRGVDARRAHGISFDVQPGEILAITGLVGCGKSQVGRILAGADTRFRGELRLDGEPYRPRDPRDARDRGVSYVPSERLAKGGIAPFTARENITLGILDSCRRGPWIDRKAERARADDWLDRAVVHPADPELLFTSFSGGNQQKLVLSRALAVSPRLLVVDEPTQGVDVGAIPVLYQQLRAAADGGAAVVVITSSYEEAVDVADRAVVMDRGHVVAELTTDALTVEALLQVPAAATPDPHEGHPHA